MKIRRTDIVAWAGLLILAHVLLVSRWVEPFVNLALCVVNLYFVTFGALLFRWRREANRPVAAYMLSYALGYTALLLMCFVYNRQWQPRFFLFAILHISLFRLPLGITLLWLFIGATLVGQIFNRAHPDEPLAILPVYLVSGKEILARTCSNNFGEFQLDYEPRSRLSLHIRGNRNLPGQIELPLGRLGGETTPRQTAQSRPRKKKR